MKCCGDPFPLNATILYIRILHMTHHKYISFIAVLVDIKPFLRFWSDLTEIFWLFKCEPDPEQYTESMQIDLSKVQCHFPQG